jgi:poly-gamma-glutamate capsule biosynthesis protein CapA/YwtB (metallophosphatase superfamily)
MAARFLEWTKRPGAFRFVVAFLCLAAIAGGYTGVEWYLGRPDEAPVSAATVAPTVGPTPTPSGPIVVHGTGDVNLDPGQLHLLASGYEEPWTGVRELFRSDDVTVINLECAASDKGSKVPDKEFNFRCPRGFEAMRESGVDVANQGNNHSLDFGAAAAMDARVNLSRAGVIPVGTGHDADEAHEPAILHVKGKTVAVLGFGGVIPFRGWVARPGHPGMADGDDIPSMVAAVKAADAIADLVFVAIHWGAERETKPQAGDVQRAHAMIDAGADGIFGHHAHRLQPLEFYKGRPIFYGLGNFVWPRPGATAVAEVIVEPEGKIRACLLPGRISGGRPSLVAPSDLCA